MRPGDVEQWAALILDRVARSQPIEDARVEVKRALPADPFKMARALGGHANEARGDRLLWLIGVAEVDGHHEVVGVNDQQDLDAWWRSVAAHFDDVAPDMEPVHVDTGGGLVVTALGFDTSRPPYVLRLSTGSPSREVPWRSATGTRSANRFDLLRLLVPVSRAPTVTPLEGTLTLHTRNTDKLREYPAYWSLDLTLYVDTSHPLVIPDHRLRVTCGLRSHADGLELSDLACHAEEFASQRDDHHLAQRGHRQITVNGSAPIYLFGRADVYSTDVAQLDVPVRVVLDPAGADTMPVVVDCVMVPDPSFTPKVNAPAQGQPVQRYVLRS